MGLAALAVLGFLAELLVLAPAFLTLLAALDFFAVLAFALTAGFEAGLADFTAVFTVGLAFATVAALAVLVTLLCDEAEPVAGFAGVALLGEKAELVTGFAFTGVGFAGAGLLCSSPEAALANLDAGD
ncbi:hypothetical protein CSQ89_14535 [Chitinimonas sp. BJB300]|nr:hypothetical protein CSQ89_14535 [Chitinimonas sp. BJB300]